MTATLFTTRINPKTLSDIREISRAQKTTNRHVVEKAIEYYAVEQKRHNIRVSFQDVSVDTEMHTLAETGLDVLQNV